MENKIMATSEQKKELVEEIKGPHYYRISVNGYGAETAYIKLNKEAYDFWKQSLESGDSDCLHYALNAEDKKPADVNADEEYEDINAADIPREAMFLHDNDDDVGSPWYEAPNEFDHVWGVASDSAYINIEKVDSAEYNASHLEDIVENEDLSEFTSRISEETDWEVELTEGLKDGSNYANKGDYVLQFMSSEKGTFFEGILETPGLIDLKKLKFTIDEAPNGEDTLFDVSYDGEEIDNQGGDTNGKGYSAYVWQE